MESISAPAIRRSTSRLSSVRPHHGQHLSYAGAAGRPEREKSALVIAAIRSSSGTKSRKAQRHLTAFGVKVPPEIEESQDYQLPEWVFPTEDTSMEVDMPEQSQVLLPSDEVASHTAHVQPTLHVGPITDDAPRLIVQLSIF